jgi:hypothetical protein
MTTGAPTATSPSPEESSTTSNSVNYDAIWTMEADVNGVEETAIENNYKQAQQQATISQAIVDGLIAAEEEIENYIEEIEKAEKSKKHKHGVFSVVKDFAKSLKKALSKLGNDIGKTASTVLTDMAEGKTKGLGKTLEKGLSQLGSIDEALAYGTGMTSLLKGAEDLASGNWKKAGVELKSGSESLGEASLSSQIPGSDQAAQNIMSGNIQEGFTQLISGALLQALTGPVLASYMQNTSFGRDMDEVASLCVDVAEIGSRVTVAGLEALAGQEGLAKNTIDKCKSVGIDIIENPAFQVLSDVAMIMMIAGAALSGQIWLAAILTVVLVANDFGGTDCAQKGIAKALEAIDPSLSKSMAKFIADIVIIVAVTAITAGSASGSAAADVAAKEAGGEIEMVAMNGADTSSTALKSSADTASTVAESAGEKAVQSIPAQVRAALMAFGVILGQSSIVSDGFKAFDKEGNQALERILLITQEVFAAVVAIGAGASMVGDEFSALDQTTSSALRNVAPSMTEYLEENMQSLSEIAAKSNILAMFLQGSVETGEGFLEMLMGHLEAAMGRVDGDLSILDAAQTTSSNQIDQNNKNLQTLMSEFDQIISEIVSAPALVGQGIAQALTQNA